MEMKIEEIKNELRSDLIVKRMTGDDYSESLRDCLAQLLAIAEKYQKIVEIYEKYKDKYGLIGMQQIGEVIKDGNNTK